MNIKKILASVAASVVAVSAMSAVAFAETAGTASVTKVTLCDADGNVVKEIGDGSAALMSKTGNDESSKEYVVDLSDLTEEQVASITAIEADVTITGDYVNGCIGINSAAKSGWDGGPQMELKANGKFSRTVEAGDLVVKDDDGNLAPVVQVQFWWVNPVPENAAPDDTSKPNTDTGVEGVAAVVGVAVVAAGAMVVAKKRK